MALTPETIVQMAVGHLGDSTKVNDVTTSPVTKAEFLGQIWFTRERDRILAKHNWSWATRHAALTDATAAEITTPGRTDWLYAYSLPSDIERFLGIDVGVPLDSGAPPEPWKIEMNAAGTGRILFCNVESAIGIYASKVTNLDLWDADAIDALVWAVAFKLAMPLSAKSDFAQLAKSMAEETLNKAIADDSSEAKPAHDVTSEIITSRAW